MDASGIGKDMPVIGSDGETIGHVDAVEGHGADARIKLKRSTSADGVHHFVAMRDVVRVDARVHLGRSAADVRAGFLTPGHAAEPVASTATATRTEAVNGAREVHVSGGGEDDRNWLPWILGALALLALLVFGLRSCEDADRARSTELTTLEAKPEPPVPAGAVVREERVMLPGGGAAMLARRTIGHDLQQYLASADPAPRTFEFERLGFDTAKADIRAADRATVDGIAQILAAYPAARVRLVGYADARGDAGANRDLGARRAQAVASALTAKGVAANRIEVATAGETGPTDTNANAGGQAENRRTELVVLSK